MSESYTFRNTYTGKDPTRRAIGWAVVVVVHIIVFWALVTGTARKGLELIKKPLEAAVIQEVIIPPPPPPPPREKPPEKPIIKNEAPPPPFIPPPDIPPPVSNAPSIASVATPPPVMAPIAPPPPPAPTGRQEIGVACPTQVRPEMPRAALKEGTSGVVRAQVLIRGGAVQEVTILSGPRVFHAPVRNAMMQYKCIVSPGDVIATQEFAFKVDQ